MSLALQSKRPRLLRVTAMITCVFFLASDVCLFGQVITALPTRSSEKPAADTLAVTLPSALGTVEEILPGQGPVLFHIQEAHGDRYSQKKIAKILAYLEKQYGVLDLFLEGNAAELHPEFVRFFPEKPEWTREAADQLLKSGHLSGPERYLALSAKAKAYPIEQKKVYEENLRAFKEVLEAREKSQVFLNSLDLQIKRLAAPYLSADLKRWAARLEDYQGKRIPFESWLAELKKRAFENLDIRLDEPHAQADWPMLVRLLALQRMEKEINPELWAAERAAFMEAISRFVPADLSRRAADQLQEPTRRTRLPAPETGLFFEGLASALPADFDYARYPQVMLLMGRLILQSELNAQELAFEMETLQSLITARLADSPEEKEIMRLLESYRLLEKLFALEWTGEEYGRVEKDSASGGLKPSNLIQQFIALNQEQRVRDLEAADLDAVDALYDKALMFYRLARQRDGILLERLQNTMAEKGIKKAAVITGGFHAQPFRRHFAEKNQNYVLITPAMSARGSREAYVDSILKYYDAPPHTPKSAAARLFDAALTAVQDFPEGWPAEPSRDLLRTAVTAVLKAHQQVPEERLNGMAFILDTRRTAGRSEVRSLSASEIKRAEEAWKLFDDAAVKFLTLTPGNTGREEAEAALKNLTEKFISWRPYSQDEIDSFAQLKTELQLSLPLFFSLIRWVYWLKDENQYSDFLLMAEELTQRIIAKRTQQLYQELRLPYERGMISREENERLTALAPSLLGERLTAAADYLKTAAPLFFLWNETIGKVRPAEERLPLTEPLTINLDLIGMESLTVQKPVFPRQHEEFVRLNQVLFLNGLIWLRGLSTLLSVQDRHPNEDFKALAVKETNDFIVSLNLAKDASMNPFIHLAQMIEAGLDENDLNFLEVAVAQIDKKLNREELTEQSLPSLELIRSGVASLRRLIRLQRSEVRNWVFKNVPVSDMTGMKMIEKEIWRLGSVDLLKDVMPEPFGSPERRRVQVFNPAGLRIASWTAGDFSTPKGQRKDASLLSELLLSEAEAYLKDLIHPDMDVGETRASLSLRYDETGTPWFDIYLSFPENPPELASGVFRGIGGAEHQDFHALFLRWYPLFYVQHEMPIEVMDLDARRLEKVGERNDSASYRQAALERIGETAYLIRDELALNKGLEEIAVQTAELLEVAGRDFIKSGDTFQKDEPLWAGKGYPDYGMKVLREEALALVTIMASLYRQPPGAKSEVRSAPPNLSSLSLVEGDASIPLAIRYLDLFFQLAEHKVTVENEVGERDFNLEIPRGGKRVSYTPPGKAEVLLLATDFKFPGTNEPLIVMESDYPVWLDWQKGSGILQAVYIAADKEQREFLKLEILRKKRSIVELEPFNALSFLGDYRMKGPLILESIVKEIPAKIRNGLVLRASIIQPPEGGFKPGDNNLQRRSEMRAAEAFANPLTMIYGEHRTAGDFEAVRPFLEPIFAEKNEKKWVVLETGNLPVKLSEELQRDLLQPDYADREALVRAVRQAAQVQNEQIRAQEETAQQNSQEMLKSLQALTEEFGRGRHKGFVKAYLEYLQEKIIQGHSVTVAIEKNHPEAVLHFLRWSALNRQADEALQYGEVDRYLLLAREASRVLGRSYRLRDEALADLQLPDAAGRYPDARLVSVRGLIHLGQEPRLRALSPSFISNAGEWRSSLGGFETLTMAEMNGGTVQAAQARRLLLEAGVLNLLDITVPGPALSLQARGRIFNPLLAAISDEELTRFLSTRWMETGNSEAERNVQRVLRLKDFLEPYSAAADTQIQNNLTDVLAPVLMTWRVLASAKIAPDDNAWAVADKVNTAVTAVALQSGITLSLLASAAEGGKIVLSSAQSADILEINPKNNGEWISAVYHFWPRESIRSEVRSDPVSALPRFERYEKMTDFYTRQKVIEGTNSDGTLFVPSPLGVLPLIFNEIQRVLGRPLDTQNYLSLGAGLLHDALYAAAVEKMNVTAVERDPGLSAKARTILEEAQEQNLVSRSGIRFLGEADAFDQSWANVDAAYFFYTQSGIDRETYRANFEKRLLERLGEMKPGSVLAMLFTGSQLMAEQDVYDGLEAYFQDQVQVSTERTGLYLRLYKIPEEKPAEAARSEVRNTVDDFLTQSMRRLERLLPDIIFYEQTVDSRQPIATNEDQRLWLSVLRMRDELEGYEMLGLVPPLAAIQDSFTRDFLEAFVQIKHSADLGSDGTMALSLEDPEKSLEALFKISSILQSRLRAQRGPKGSEGGEVKFLLPSFETLFALMTISQEIILQFAAEASTSGAEMALRVISMRLLTLKMAKGFGIPVSHYGAYEELPAQIQLMSYLAFGETLEETDFLNRVNESSDGTVLYLLDRSADLFNVLFEMKRDSEGARRVDEGEILKLLAAKLMGFRAHRELDKVLVQRAIKVITNQVVFRSEVRLAPAVKDVQGAEGEILTPARWTLARYATRQLLPLTVRARYGAEVFRGAIQELLEALEPEKSPVRPELSPEIMSAVRANMPELYRLLTAPRLTEARRLFEDAARNADAAVSAPETLLPMIVLLAARPDLEYTLILEGDEEAAKKFREALTVTVKKSKLGFNPFDLPNFKAVFEAEESGVRRFMGQSLSKTQGSTAIVSPRNTLFDPLNAVPNLVRVQVKNPLRQRDAVMLTAVFLDELIRSALARYDEDSLAEPDYAESLLLEIKALQTFLAAA